MNKGIAHILMQELTQLPYLQRFGGLVTTMEQEETFAGYDGEDTRRIIKKYPVTTDYCITKPGECAKSGYLDFTPDSNYLGQVYFEDKGVDPDGRDGKMWKYKSHLRMVVWLNTKAIVTTNGYETLPGHSISIAVMSAMQDKFDALENRSVGYYHRIKVTEQSIPETDSSIFDKYTFDKYANQYLLDPYEFFAVDYTIEYRINPSCIDDITISLDNLNCNCPDAQPVPAQYPQLVEVITINTWQQGDTIEVADAIDKVYDMNFKGTISNIIYINGTPVAWKQLGIVQNKREDDPEAPGYLDFTNYSLAEIPGEGSITGLIDYMYKK